MRIRIISITISVLLIILFMNFCIRNDTWQVKKQFEELSEVISLRQGESLIGTGMKKNRFMDYFAPKCTFNSDISAQKGPFTPMELSNRIFAIRNRFLYLSVNFVDVKVSFPTPGKAAALFTIKATGKLDEGRIENYYREADCLLTLTNGKWLVSEITTVEVLKK